MKKVLIISYAFPPLQVIGSQRPYNLAKYFPKYGWETIVLTVKHPGKPPEGIRVIETNYKDIIGTMKSKLGFSAKQGMHDQLGITVNKDYDYPTLKSKIIKLSKEIITFPDPNKGWYKFAMKSASEFLKTERVNAIISTSPPIITHLIARELKNRYKIPWIADLRDPWSRQIIDNKLRTIKYFEKRLEIKTLSDADALVTVTPRFAENHRMTHKDKKIFCITNGYDPDDFPKMATKLTSKLTITYTGSLYNGKMDPSMLFDVVSLLIRKNRINKDLIEIRFYSKNANYLINEIKKYNLEGIVNYYGFLPRKVVLEKQKESQLLLLLVDKNTNVDYYPAKVFEYFGARRPILALGGKGEIVKELLEENNAGKFADTVENLKDIIFAYYQEFTGIGKIEFHSNSKIENYSYSSIVKKYSDVLNSIVLK